MLKMILIYFEIEKFAARFFEKILARKGIDTNFVNLAIQKERFKLPIKKVVFNCLSCLIYLQTIKVELSNAACIRIFNTKKTCY